MRNGVERDAAVTVGLQRHRSFVVSAPNLNQALDLIAVVGVD
jgi:hypothetical protein